MREILKKKSVRIVLVVICAVIIVIIVGLVVQSGQKQQKIQDHLELGAKFLDELDYEQAIAEYAAVLEIEPKNQRALNGLETVYLEYAQKMEEDGKLEEARLLLEQGYRQFEIAILQERAAEDVYTDRDALITLWEEGYEKSRKDSRVQDNLVSVYLEQAEERASSGAYEESLQTYDHLLELDGQDEAVQESLSKSLKSYMDLLMEEENFDRIRELEEKYASVLPNFDFEFYTNEILRIQLELPFAPEDVTIFGYKLTEDHFDDIVADLNLSLHQYYRGNELRWHYHGDDDKSDIEAEVEDDGSKCIVVSDMDMDPATDNRVWAYEIHPNGSNAYVITKRGLNWLQDHYAPGDNLPLISCLGKKMDAWYRSLPIDVIKEIGEYREYPVDNSSEEYWEVEEPVRVTFSYAHDSDGGASYIMYQYPTGYFASWVYLNHEGIIDKMVYQWGPAIRYSP